MPKKSVDNREFGDFQTPDYLAKKIIDVLKNNYSINPDIIIEPTCGKGAFIRASYKEFKQSKILGFEINPDYIAETKKSLKTLEQSNRVKIQQTDFFNNDWGKIISENNGYILIIGNPPWVTSSELSVLNSQNLPAKSNFQNRKGMEAITGSANFDISEWMLLQHIKWLSKRKGMIAFLCKYTVARKVMRQVRQNAAHRFFGYIYLINAKIHFNASVEACLFVLTTDAGNTDYEVYESLDSLLPSQIIGERDGYIVSNVNKYERWKHLKGQNYIWRSGVKHDCAKVMELEPVNDGYKNGFGKTIQCEEEYLYPLLKSSDVGNGRIHSYRKVVLITQKFIGEDTSKIKDIAPKTWNYLIEYQKYLDDRKSVIYKNKPLFSVFGIGDYSFQPWKIAISGLYKKLQFNLVGPLNRKTVIFDDTVNFLSFDSKEEAEFMYQMITSVPATEFFESMIFWDAKRPITTEILGRLSIKEISRVLGKSREYCQYRSRTNQINGILANWE